MTDNPQNANEPPSIKIFGKAGSAIAYKLRDYLERSDVPFAVG